ncbi:hypothetical protein ABIE56_002361 [Luteibacter sp. 621]|uniref:hypothetical protein n=1 Tax=Luteibacter sp. 621 TaxID=3373916 RepID=UPI003D1CD657
MIPTPAPVHASNPRLAELLARMALEGYGTLRAQSIRLGIPAGALRNYAAGFPLPEEVAGDIEWMMELSDGWLDYPAAATTALVDDRRQGMMASA